MKLTRAGLLRDGVTIVCGSLLVLLSMGVWGASVDETGLEPTLHVTFDAKSVVNDNGTGTITSKNEGTVTYVPAPNGMAIDTSKYTPYGDLSGVTVDGSSFTVSAFATLGINDNGIMWHLKGGTHIVMRRGAQANQVFITLGDSTEPVLTANDVTSGDQGYNHYVVVVGASGMTLYINGAVAGSTTSTAISGAKNNFQFGSRHGGIKAGEVKNGGQIDDFRVYNAALSVEQVGTLYAKLVGTEVISIKAGLRGDNEAGGNVELFADQSVGVVPVLGGSWNKTQLTTSGGAAGFISDLKNRVGVATTAKLYYAYPNLWSSAAATNTIIGTLTKTYFDDGPASTYTVNDNGTGVVLPDPGITRGWEAMLVGVPYEHVDLYLYYASDQAMDLTQSPPILIKVGSGEWVSYFGSAGQESTFEGGAVWRPASYAINTFKEGAHYLKIPLSNLTPSTEVAITHGVRSDAPPAETKKRVGLAGIQVVKRDSAIVVGDDPYYRRSVSGNVAWDDETWSNGGSGNQSWLDSDNDWKTTAIITASGGTTLEMPDGGVTVEAVMLLGDGAFALDNSGSLSFNGVAALDAGNYNRGAVVSIDAPVNAEILTLAANNPAGGGVGYVRLGSESSDYDTLKLVKGTLAANSKLPDGATIEMADRSALMFTASGEFEKDVDIAGDIFLRVWSGATGSMSGAINGSGNITKSDSGNLMLSGGGTFGNFSWNNGGTINFEGVDPFNFAAVTGANANETTLNLAAPVNISGKLSLGRVNANLLESGNVVVRELAMSEGGAARDGVFIQSGGQLVVVGSNNDHTTSASIKFCHWNSISSYTITGGKFLATNAVPQISWDGFGTMTVTGSAHAYLKGVNVHGRSSATLNLTGGLLELGSMGLYSGDTTKIRAVNFGGGVLRAWDNFTVQRNVVSEAINLTDTTVGTVVDPAGHVITWSAPVGGSGKLVVKDSTETVGTLRLSNVVLRPAALSFESGINLELKVTDKIDLSESSWIEAGGVVTDLASGEQIDVVLDLSGASYPLASYPVLLSDGLPEGILDDMTVDFKNAGAKLPSEATVELQLYQDGVYAVFSGVVAPKNLFWRNGSSSGNWSVDAQDNYWGIDGVDGEASAFAIVDTVNFVDTDKTAVSVAVKGSVTPVGLNINNSETSFTLNEELNGGNVVLPAAGLLKNGSGLFTLNVPVKANSGQVRVNDGVLRFGALIDGSTQSKLTTDVVVAEDGVLEFAGDDGQEISGTTTGSGVITTVDGGYVKLSGPLNGFSGEIVAAGGTLEISKSDALLSSSAGLSVAAGGTLVMSGQDVTGYNHGNTVPVEVAGTVILKQRDTLRRGYKLYDGAEVLLKGDNMDSSRALDLFKDCKISLVSGSAIIKPLDPEVADHAKIELRRDHNPEMPKVLEAVDSDAVLTIAVPFQSLTVGNRTILKKEGAGSVLLTSPGELEANVNVATGTLEIGGSGSLSARVSSHTIEVASGACFLYSSSAEQTLPDTITVDGRLEKVGSGKLVLSGSVTVGSGGELALPGVRSGADAVQADNLTLNGGIVVNNFDALNDGPEYAVLRGTSALPSGIETKVINLPAGWRAELVDDGKCLVVKKPLGTVVILR